MFFSCNENIDGCIDIEACNYDSNATVDDESCVYNKSTDDWSIQIVASMNPWTILDPIFDENNILGVSENSLDEFDSWTLPSLLMHLEIGFLGIFITQNGTLYLEINLLRTISQMSFVI